MKNLLTTLLLLVGVSAWGQGTAIRSQNGFGTNTSFYGTTTNAPLNRMGSTVLGSTWSLIDTNGLSRIAVIDTMLTLRDTNNIRFRIDGNGGVSIYDTNGTLVFWANTNQVSIVSPAANASDNIALLVASSNLWNSGAMLAVFRNAGTNRATLNWNGAMGIGYSEDWWGGLDSGETRVSVRDIAKGDSDYNADYIVTQDSSAAADYEAYVGSDISVASALWSLVVETNSVLYSAEVRAEQDPNTPQISLKLKAQGTFRTRLEPTVADGAAAIAYLFDTRTTLANAAAKIASFKNAGSEKVFVDKDGKIVSIGTPGFVGDGGGLTNLIGATNFNSSVTYNFNGKVTFNSVSYLTNAWAGPTNPIVLTTNYQFYVASTDCAITGVSGQLADQNTWSTLTVSNSTASPITVRSTATGFRPQGSSTTTALIIGAGKEGYLSFHSRGVLSTNFVTTTQQ